MKRFNLTMLILGAGALFAASTASADSIDPASYSASLSVGESVTIRKTVTVDDAPTSAVVDVVFLMDTSGSMGGVIAAAKTAASNILTGLDAFGDVATGVGYYSDPGADGAWKPLTTDVATAQANINSLVTGLGGGGGDFPELGYAGVDQAVAGQPWRAGSNRFIVALGDATFKAGLGSTEATAIASLLGTNVTFIGIDFGSMDPGTGSPAPLAAATGGAIYNSAIGATAITDAIIASITSSFASYTGVTVSDLGAGLPGVDVDVTCVSSDAGLDGLGACVGDTATGDFDRSITRTFEFDVTFTGLEEGVFSFGTRALVDGGIVATEADRITVGGAVPVPAPLALLTLGLIGMLSVRSRKAA